MATWPATLPQSFEADGWTNQPTSGVIRTEMDTGPAKVRRRFSAISQIHSGNMIMTKALFIGDFTTFFYTTIAHGALEFDFPDPISGTPVAVRWVIEGEPFRIRQYTPSDVLVSFSLEVLP